MTRTAPAHDDREPDHGPGAPSALEAERALIGAALIDAHRVVPAVEQMVAPDDFYVPSHKVVWEAIVDLSVTTTPDVVTVLSWLQARGLIGTGPGTTAESLNGYQLGTPAVSMGPTYAALIVDARVRRDMIAAAAEITKLATGSPEAGAALDRARELVAHLDSPTGAMAPALDVQQFLEGVDHTVTWCIPGFLARRDRLLVTGMEGSGKSVLLTQIAVQAAAGVHPWNNRRIPPVRTLIIDSENGEQLLAERLDDLVSRAPADMDPDYLRVISRPRGLNLHKRVDRQWLYDAVRVNGAELLLIGPAYRLSRGAPERGDAGGEQHTLAITDALDEMRDRYGVTLIMETHSPHGGGPTGRDLRPVGSSVWLRWPEFGIGLRRTKENAGDYHVEHWRGPRSHRVWPSLLRKGIGPWPWQATMPTGSYETRSPQPRLDYDPALEEPPDPRGEEF